MVVEPIRGTPPWRASGIGAEQKLTLGISGFRFCPQADLHGGIVDRPRVKRKLLRLLFNHLVGALQQRLRHGEAECLRCLQVDD